MLTVARMGRSAIRDHRRNCAHRSRIPACGLQPGYGQNTERRLA